MKIQESLDRIDAQIETLKKQRENVVLLGEKLADYPHEVSISAFGDFIDFDNLNRAQVVSLLTHLKSGKWDKAASGQAGKIDYVNSTFLKDAKLRIWGAEPPASCKIVEVEVEIPAQPARIEKQKKLVCKNHELQAI